MITRTAHDIAEWFVAWAEHADADLSQLKLQKLLYYAKGESFARLEETLFEDRMEAWTHGPVVRSIYDETKHFGRNPIDPDEYISECFDWDDYTDVSDLLVEVWRKYGIYSAWALREKTHRESPWLEAWEKGQNSEISDAALKEFFVNEQ